MGADSGWRRYAFAEKIFFWADRCLLRNIEASSTPSRSS